MTAAQRFKWKIDAVVHSWWRSMIHLANVNVEITETDADECFNIIDQMIADIKGEGINSLGEVIFEVKLNGR